MLLGFLQYQRDSVLKIVEGLPEEVWQTPVVPSGWPVAGMLWHLGGVEHHWLQHVTTGVMEEPPTDEERGTRSSKSPRCPRPRAGSTFTLTRSTPSRSPTSAGSSST